MLDLKKYVCKSQIETPIYIHGVVDHEDYMENVVRNDEDT